MKRVLNRTAFAVAVAALVATTAGAFAQNPPPPRQGRGAGMGWGAGMGRGPGGPGPMGMLQQLNLTADQRTKIQSIMQEHRQATQADAQTMRDLQQQLKNAIFADSPGDTSALLEQIASLEAKLQTGRIAVEKQIAAILTADQRKQVRDTPGPGLGPMMGRGRGMGRGMGRGPGR
jgi:Spy/CpxP family protein refolding chaperone